MATVVVVHIQYILVVATFSLVTVERNLHMGVIAQHLWKEVVTGLMVSMIVADLAIKSGLWDPMILK